MARRPHARLITAGFDLHDVSFRTEYHSSKPSVHSRQRVPPIGSPPRQIILCSKRVWQKGKREYRLRPVAELRLGHAVKLTMVTVKGKQRWKWTVESIMCLGVCNGLKEAQVAALEKILQVLGSPTNYAAFQNLANLTGHDFI